MPSNTTKPNARRANHRGESDQSREPWNGRKIRHSILQPNCHAPLHIIPVLPSIGSIIGDHCVVYTGEQQFICR